MKIIEPEVHILSPLNKDLLVHIERAGRTCYKSEREFTHETADKFVRMLISRGHESVLEHSNVTVKFIVDRGVSHEIVRHRIASYSQESTRYCNYSKEKFGSELTFIRPFRLNNYDLGIWEIAMETAEDDYLQLIKNGVEPEWARSVLPHSIKTELVLTFNAREWRHFFKLRCALEAHPQMREVTLPLYYEFLDKIPALVEDIEIKEEALEGIPFAEVVYSPWGSPKVNELPDNFVILEWIGEEDDTL